MLMLRPAQWPRDAEALSSLDTTFVTQRIYRVLHDESSFRLAEETVAPPLRKRYEFNPADPRERESWDFAAVAEEEGRLAAFAAAQYTAWNRRVILWHLYVMPSFRRQGVGSRLLAEVEIFAAGVGARCLWLETQNLNFPAIQFYRRAGFQFCGFDASLYDPAGLEHDEMALFFARPVAQSP